MWRIGVLSGTGTARKRTIPALLRSSFCRVTTVHGRDPDRLAEIAKLDQTIRLTSSLSEFAAWRSHYDLIYLGSPPFLHLTQLEFAIRLRAPVICEKPLVADRRHLIPVLELLDGADIPFMVAHHVRHQPAAEHVRTVVREGYLGAVTFASLQWCFRMSHDARNASWKLDPARAGSNALFDSGVHAVDLALFLFGTPQRVGAVGSRIRESPTIDSVVALLDYSSFAVMISTSQSASPAANDLTITFTGGAVRVPAMLGELSVGTVDVVDRNGSRTYTYRPVDLYRAEVEDFCRSLEGGPNIGTTAGEAVVASRILFTAEDAVRSGELVNVLPLQASSLAQ